MQRTWTSSPQRTDWSRTSPPAPAPAAPAERTRFGLGHLWRVLAFLTASAAGGALGLFWFQRGWFNPVFVELWGIRWTSTAPIDILGLKEFALWGGTFYWPYLLRPVVEAVLVLALIGTFWWQGREDARTRREGRGARTGTAACWFAVSAGLGMLALYVLSQMLLRARHPSDMLLWSESSFVQDMLKLHLGLPPYLPAEQHNSFVYNPGAPMLTWAISSLCGSYGDLAFCRTLQIDFLLTSCGVALWTALRLARIALPAGGTPGDRPAPALVLALGLFLLAAGTNQHTAPFVDLLHNDALVILTCTLGLAALVVRGSVRPGRWLALASTLPALAFAMKQTGVVVGLGLVLGVLIQERSFRKALQFGLLSAAWVLAFAAVMSLWSQGWWSYWTITVLAKQPWLPDVGWRFNSSLILPFSPLVLAATGWLVWGTYRVREPRGRVVLSALIYTGLLAGAAAVTTLKWGTATANHWGPAGLGLATLAAAGVVRLVQGPRAGRAARVALNLVAAGGIAVAAILLHTTPLQFERYVPGAEEAKYAARLKRAFRARDPERTLLAHGTMPYLKCNLLPRDRCNSVLETSNGGVRQIGAFMERIQGQWYERIFIPRIYPQEWYGKEVMRAIQDYYEVKSVLEGMAEPTPWWLMFDNEVYEPKPAAVVAQLPPHVLYLEPAGHCWTSRPPRVVTVTFSHPMDPATMTAANLSLEREAPESPGKAWSPVETSPPDRVEYDPATRTAAFRLPKPLTPGLYKVEANKWVRAADGRGLRDGRFSETFQIMK